MLEQISLRSYVLTIISPEDKAFQDVPRPARNFAKYHEGLYRGPSRYDNYHLLSAVLRTACYTEEISY